MSESKAIYVSVDFGTEGTGCAVGTSAKSIYEHNWANSENRVGSDRAKTRTAVLVSPDDLSTPLAFGDQAYDVYADALMRDPDGTAKQMLLFDYFKMSLAADEKTGQSQKRPTVYSVTGQPAPAAKVLTAAFRAIYKSVFDRLSQSSGGRITPKDITWIITVPTMWTDAAKQLMREAALLAFPDTKDSQIKIALEPEAAALCCRAQQLERQLSLSSPTASLSDLLKTGTRFIVCDLGAGTADFSQLVVASDGTIRETASASGGPWGGHLVEKRMFQFLDALFGAKAMSLYTQQYPAEHNELSRSIRTLKHRFNPAANHGFHRLPVPHSFISEMGLRERLDLHRRQTGTSASEVPLEITPDRNAAPAPATSSHDSKTDSQNGAKDTKDSTDSKSDAGKATTASGGGDMPVDLCGLGLDESKCRVSYHVSGVLRLSHDLVLWLFQEARDKIAQHVREMLKANPTAAVLFLVGGFAESRVIQDAIDQVVAQSASATAVKNEAKSDVKGDDAKGGGPLRVLPMTPGMCVMNGAVHFGMNPRLVSQRISKRSYGIESGRAWDPATMDGRTTEYRTRNGKLEAYCSKWFSRFCEVGDSIDVDFQRTLHFSPSTDKQEKVVLPLVCSSKKGVNFTDDESVTRIGTVTLDIPMRPKPAPTATSTATASTTTTQTGGVLAGDAKTQNPAEDYGLDRDFTVTMRFGCTEISVMAYDAESGNKIDCYIDCLDFDLGGNGILTRRS